MRIGQIVQIEYLLNLKIRGQPNSGLTVKRPGFFCQDTHRHTNQ